MDNQQKQRADEWLREMEEAQRRENDRWVREQFNELARQDLARILAERTARTLKQLQARARTRQFLRHPHIVWLQFLMWEVLGVTSTTTH